MSMLDEIDKLMNDANISLDYRTINLGGKQFYIEGIKSVISFGEDEISFQMKRTMLVISGNNLKVKYLDKTTCVIVGNIISVVTK
ncbi:MAG: YabP/YqfC family sporulation protein [Clostridia bacterium]|nr:YabP/YqfC family sporulation protein [Clostridia bacterium]